MAKHRTKNCLSVSVQKIWKCRPHLIVWISWSYLHPLESKRMSKWMSKSPARLNFRWGLNFTYSQRKRGFQVKSFYGRRKKCRCRPYIYKLKHIKNKSYICSYSATWLIINLVESETTAESYFLLVLDMDDDDDALFTEF